MNEDDQEVKQIGVRVPQSQYKILQREADERDLAVSKYTHQMAQAGRRQFFDDSSEQIEKSKSISDLEDQVKAILSPMEATSFDEITEKVIGDIEEDIGAVISEADWANYDPVAGGYKISEG